MRVKIAFLVSILVVSGCYIGPSPKGYKYSTYTIGPATFYSIVANEFVPQKVHDIEGKFVSVKFRDHVCPCNYERDTRIKAIEVDSTGIIGSYQPIKGFPQPLHTYFSKYDSPLGYPASLPKECESFEAARRDIVEAAKLSKRGNFIYLPSYEFIWQAEMALGPSECDVARAKKLADQANKIAQKDGAIALGYAISGWYDLTLSLNDRSGYFGFRSKRVIPILLEHSGTEILGYNTEGIPILKGREAEEILTWRAIYNFRLQSQELSSNEIVGKWVQDSKYEGWHKSPYIIGSWEDPVAGVSGSWKLVSHAYEAVDYREKREKDVEKWLSQVPSTYFRFEDIEKIEVEVKEMEFEFIMRSL